MLCVGNQCFQIYRLWFDVGIKRDTTRFCRSHRQAELWFDVGIKRDTTKGTIKSISISCGLM